MVKSKSGHAPLYLICSLFFILSVAGIVALLGTDIRHHFNFSPLHQKLDAWPLIMIGLSYIVLQFAIKQTGTDRVKGIFLGIAFLCWGSEQLLPASPLVTILDEGAVTIFVVDVSYIIWDHLNKTDIANLP